MTSGSSSAPRVPVLPEDWRCEVTEGLARVLASRAFSGSERSRAFLAYVVAETLAGRGERLSERTVGRRGLQGGDAAGGRQDSSVRVRATRVRRYLDAYYQGEGAADPIRIGLPAGSYVPTFERVPVLRRRGQGHEPAVLVMLFDSVGEGAAPAATAVSEALAGRLAGFPGLRVLGPATSRSADAAQLGRQLGARFVVQGSVLRVGDSMRLSARVTDAESGEIIWAVADSLAQEPGDLWALADEWIAATAGELGDYAGILLARPNAGSPGMGGLESAARLAFYRYIIEGTNASLLEAREKLGRALADESTVCAATTLAMYANAVAVPVAYGLSEDPEADLIVAETAAREALSLDRRNAHAHLELGTVALARGQWAVAIERARAGASLGAGHPTLMATAGVLMSAAGAWDEGVQLTREALRLNPAHPGHQHSLLALDRILAGDDAVALAEAGLIHSPDVCWGPFYRSLALAGLGYLEQARTEFAAALAIEPAQDDGPLAVLRGYVNFTEDQIAVLEARIALIRSSTREMPLDHDPELTGRSSPRRRTARRS